MSASERLAALEDDRKRWIENDLIPMSAGLKLLNALPELKALTEAAELVVERQVEGLDEGWGKVAIARTLAALAEKLS